MHEARNWRQMTSGRSHLGIHEGVADAERGGHGGNRDALVRGQELAQDDMRTGHTSASRKASPTLNAAAMAAIVTLLYEARNWRKMT